MDQTGCGVRTFQIPLPSAHKYLFLLCLAMCLQRGPQIYTLESCSCHAADVLLVLHPVSISAADCSSQAP